MSRTLLYQRSNSKGLRRLLDYFSSLRHDVCYNHFMSEIILKVCYKCKIAKELTQFHKDSSNKSGVQGKCIPCAAKYYQGNRDLFLTSSRKYRLKRAYGITPERFQELLAYQDHKCALCGATEPTGKGTWHVDHDHSCCPGSTGCGQCVRGLLCHPCNVKLGVLEQAEWVEKAHKYLGDATNGRNLQQPFPG